MITITIMIMITILSLIIIIIILFLPQQEPDSDPLLISTPANHEVSYALETPGSLYQQSESSSDSEETVRGTRSSRDKLNMFLASREISPVRSQLKMQWDMASDRTQRFHIRKAKQVVDAALGEIAPHDAEKLWISLVQSKVAAQQTNDEAIDLKLADALPECYENAGHWVSPRQILSIMADEMVLLGTGLRSQGTIGSFLVEVLLSLLFLPEECMCHQNSLTTFLTL